MTQLDRKDTMRKLALEYTGDGDGDARDALTLQRYALVEKNVRSGGYWITTHPTPEEAADYQVNQDSPYDWDPVLLVDLETNTNYQPVHKLVFEEA